VFFEGILDFLECGISSSLEDDDYDVEHGGDRGEDVILKSGIRYRLSGSCKLVLDLHQAREVSADRFSCNWAKSVELSKKSYLSDNRTGCIHLPCNRRPHFGGIINLFNLNLDLIAARSTDDSAGFVAMGKVTIVDSPFSDGCGRESDWIVRWLFFSYHNVPHLYAFKDTHTLPLPGGIVGDLEELDRFKTVFVGL